MYWSPLLSTTQYVLDTTIKHNTICVGHHYKTTHYVWDTTIQHNTICVGHHYETQHNMCWSSLSNTTQYVLVTTMRQQTRVT